MRIVHEIDTPMQVGGGGEPYVNGPGKQGFSGCQMDLVLCESPAANHPELPKEMFGDHEVIHIEGNSKYIRKMLKDALVVVKLAEESSQKQLGKLRSTNCPDGCADIAKYNGTHEITCPRHVNYKLFNKRQKGK
jgi:hypothetical protein